MEPQYEHFSAEELATDPAFIGWVKRPDAATTAVWESWLLQHPQKANDIRLARQLIELWRIIPPVPSAGSQAAVWAGVQTRKNELPNDRQLVRPPIRMGRATYLRRTAAVLAGLVITAAVVFWVARDWGMTRYATQVGQTRTVTLPDGSTVVLNARSSVRFASVWAVGQPREVSLTGEGFFTVTHQKDHQKFTVETPTHLRIEVLGTVFTVDERDNQTRVVLNQGKIRLNLANESRPILMHPGELIAVSGSQQRAVIRRQVTPEVYSAWTTHQFLFDNTSLAEIAGILKQDLGYTVQFSEPLLAARRMTIRLPTQDVDVLLAAIAEAHDLTITQPDDHTIRLAPAPTPDH